MHLRQATVEGRSSLGVAAWDGSMETLWLSQTELDNKHTYLKFISTKFGFFFPFFTYICMTRELSRTPSIFNISTVDQLIIL